MPPMSWDVGDLFLFADRDIVVLSAFETDHHGTQCTSTVRPALSQRGFRQKVSRYGQVKHGISLFSLTVS